MIKKIEKIDTLLLITPSVFVDDRGEYIELYNISELRQHFPIPEYIEFIQKPFYLIPSFLQDDISISKKGVLRGFHGDDETWKLISCLYGNIFVAIVNFDKSHEFYLRHYSFTLDDFNRNMILVPPKHGLAHLVISEKAIFWYKQTTYYSGPENQFTLRWDDPKIGVDWPINNPILSTRDSGATLL
jgi:dTDP-4-dehydrorhamnose 3,5-epimerase